MRRSRPVLAAVLALGVALGAAPGAVAEETASAPRPGGGYTNPVSASFADTYADPAVIRGKDGWWYAFGTTDPLREGERTRHLLPISRSRDLVSWEYVGDAFTEDSVPSWADRSVNAALWAPDIRYVDGQYRLYYVVTETTVTGERFDNAIGVATAPSPAGPWTDSGAPVVGPRRGGPPGATDNFLWTFDPHHVRDDDGQQYLFYGSYYGGIFVAPLDDTGTRVTGDATQVTIDNKYEGAYVLRHEGYWYLFASSANCCAGPVTGYSVHVGRSADLRGPYLDREGVPLTASRAGGTPVIAPNGNSWVGTGHNAVVTDLAGEDWFVYHAIDRADPYLDEPFGINERPMLIDRLDWVDGWPTVNAGTWASETSRHSPATSGRWVSDLEGGVPASFRARGAWEAASDDQSGAHVRSTGEASLLVRGAAGRGTRVEADLRVAAGGAPASLVAGRIETARSVASGVTATVDPAARLLVVESVRRGAVEARGEAPIPAGVDLTEWHSAVLEVDGRRAYAEFSDARLGDPVATVVLDLPARARAGGAGVLAAGTGVEVDNPSVVRLAEPVTRAVPEPRLGRVDRASSDEFDGAGLREGWETVRTPAADVAGGRLVWPVETADLTGTVNDASVLLRTPPAGDWTAETKVDVDLGVDVVRNFQQAGIIAYAGDDDFARLSHVAIFNTRQTEFGREFVWRAGGADPHQPGTDRPVYGGTIVGPPSDTTWLRLTHRTDASGEREIQASTSTDGTTWVRGGVWTFPAGTDLRVGLVSHGAQPGTPAATASFDYLRFHRP